MDTEMRDKERELARLEVQSEIEDKRASIARTKSLEREAKATHGRDWKKVLGYVGKLKVRPDREVIHDLYNVGVGDFREEDQKVRDIRKRIAR